jgi:hypothetical protein
MALKQQRNRLIAQAAALITAMYAFLFSRIPMHHRCSRTQICYGPLSAMDEERQKNLDMIYNSNDVECINMLRMRKAPFFRLCNLLRERNLLRDSIHTSVEEQVAMFIHVVRHNQRFSVIHKTGGDL